MYHSVTKGEVESAQKIVHKKTSKRGYKCILLAHLIFVFFKSGLLQKVANTLGKKKKKNCLR